MEGNRETDTMQEPSENDSHRLRTKSTLITDIMAPNVTSLGAAGDLPWSPVKGGKQRRILWSSNSDTRCVGFGGLFRTIVDKLFNSYQSAFVHKTLEKKDVDYALKPLMYELHKTYLDTKKPTTYNMVKEYFHNLPVKKIQFVMNYY